MGDPYVPYVPYVVFFNGCTSAEEGNELPDQFRTAFNSAGYLGWRGTVGQINAASAMKAGSKFFERLAAGDTAEASRQAAEQAGAFQDLNLILLGDGSFKLEMK